MSSFFVTGTDTGVGKTIASRAIIQALQQAGINTAGYKPIACGQDEGVYTEHQPTQSSDHGSANNKDVLILMSSMNTPIRYQEANSYTFDHTSAPMLSSSDSQRIDLNKIDQDLQHLNQRFQSVLVEGSFGWLTPLTKGIMFSDWVAQKKMPVILVVGIKEGCINHALLTAEAITRMGIPLLGWVANRINPGLGHYAETIEVISQHIDAPLLGQIPYIHRPEEQDLGRFITNIDCLSHIKSD